MGSEEDWGTEVSVLASLCILRPLTKIFIMRRESFWEGRIVIFGDVAFDMLPGHLDRDAPIGSWTQGPGTQKAFGLDMQIWQSVLKRWNLNSWEEASQLGRAYHLRRGKGQKRITQGISTFGKMYFWSREYK